MDQISLLALWAAAWPYITAIVATASTLDAALPQPAPGSHWLIVRKVISFLAINIGNASNGKQPDFVTWIVRIAEPVLQAQGIAPAPAAKVIARRQRTCSTLSCGTSVATVQSESLERLCAE